MSAETLHPRVILLMGAVFLALVVMHLWMGDEGNNRTGATGVPQLAGISITEEDDQVDIGLQEPVSALEELVASRTYLLLNGEGNERRVTAIQLAEMTADPPEAMRLVALSAETRKGLRAACLKGLNDPDVVVSANCRDALLGMWRLSDSVAVVEQFMRGLLAYEQGRLDAALESFERAERLQGFVPPDLYRMKAQVFLARAMYEDALAQCKQALGIEPLHFRALLVAAQARAQLGDEEEALGLLGIALGVYESFAEARQLRQEIAERRRPR
jgi:tetratricopeptide (TPR) repeat protein